MAAVKTEPQVKWSPGRPRLLEPSPDFVERREQIIAAAAKVFQEKGYDAGTLDDVAQVLDLRRASLYYYVGSKAKLLFMLFERGLEIALGKVDELVHLEDPAQRLEAFIRHQVRTVAGDPSLFSVFFDNRPRLDSEYEEAIRQKEHLYAQHYRDAVDAAVAAGVISAADSRYAAQALFGMTTWCYKWFRPKDDIEAFADVCVSMVLGRNHGRRRLDGRGVRRGGRD
jgi:AcrR family transcriptional regulator